VRVNFSARLSTAIALLAGRLTPAELEPAWLRDHEDEIRDLAARVKLRQDPGLTAQTLLGTLEAGASPDVGLRDLLRIRRRLGDVNMDEANPGPALLGAVRADPRLRRAFGEALRARLSGRAAAGGIDDLDVDALRMTFPSRMRVHLRDGSVIRLEGTEPASSGRPLDEQRMVVEEKLAVAGIGSGRAVS
jgi:hypothetical protein